MYSLARANKFIETWWGNVRVAVLCGISASLDDYLLAANKKAEEAGHVSFILLPDDIYCARAWGAMASYAARQELDDSMLDMDEVIDMWLLGEKFDYPAFQDRAMLELLWWVSVERATQDDIVKVFENSPPNSKIRNLMAKEVCRLSTTLEPSSWRHFERFDGFLVDYFVANKRIAGQDQKTLLRRSGGAWEEFMVEHTLRQDVREYAEQLFES